MALELTTKQVAFLRSKAHALGPLLHVGKEGVGEGLRRELDQALARQELVKVRLGRYVAADLAGLADALGAALVQRVGRMAVFYRPADEPILELPR